MRKLVLAGLVLVAGCGAEITNPLDTSPWVGTWRLTSQECPGFSFVQTGFARVTLVLGESKGTTIVEFASGCNVRMEDYLITPIGQGQFEFPTITSERVICNPNPCNGEVTTTFSDGQTIVEQSACPDDFPPIVTGAVLGRVDGNFIVAEIDTGVMCTLRYARE